MRSSGGSSRSSCLPAACRRPRRPSLPACAPYDLGGRRAVDLAGACVGLTLASPLLAAAAVAIKLDDGGPVLYRQRRVGRDAEEFEMLKLRTMIVGAETQGSG